jgi:hypothetical protein
MSYYVVETNYEGPNRDRYIDADRVEIWTVPARHNTSGRICLEGWCGTTNDWGVYAHGEYDTLEGARAAIAEKFGGVREGDVEPHERFLWDYDGDDDGEIVERYRLGAFIPYTRDETAEWAWESMEQDITANTTDERLGELVDEYEAAANREGITLHDDLWDVLAEFRERLREDEEEDEDEE